MLDQAKEALYTFRDLVEERSSFADTSHLKLFVSSVRPVAEEYQLVDLSGEAWSDDRLSFASPEGVEFYENTWTNGRDRTLWLEDFAKGVSALAYLVAEEKREILRRFLHEVFEFIEDQRSYPMLTLPLARYAAEVSVKVLQNGEPATLESLLAYNHGLWWAMAYLRGVDEELVKRVHQVLMVRAERGVIEDI